MMQMYKQINSTVNKYNKCSKPIAYACVLSHVRLCATPWTVACQAPLSLGFSRQEWWSRLPFSPPGGLPEPEIEPQSPSSPALQADSLPLSHQGSPTTHPVLVIISDTEIIFIY